MAFRKYVVHRRVVVNLIGGNAIEGVVTAQAGPLLVIKGATLHEVGADAPTPMDGDVVVERSHIDFIQAL